ncbi:hypothetical protein [Frankia sp. Cj5]|uniref:hypothetical protein n=1 Tax=Frankia sp. Cj5 TaxID=2880978 RepID=UPI001EF3D818|nr:hypothetical protein [Frankia sp. Cj5]
MLVHMVGAADLGTRPGPEFTKKLDELVAADPSEAARMLTESADPRRPPLVAVFAAGAPHYDRVVFVVTRPQAGPAPDENFTRPLGAAIKERLECEGLYGVRFQPGAVELLEVSAPHMSGVRAAIRDRLLTMRADGVIPAVDLPFGGGATNGAFGLVAGILEANVEPRLVLSLAGGGVKRIRLSQQLPTENADRWLVRHRFYSPMLKRDPDNADFWQDRLNRQILVTETTYGSAVDLARVLLERIDRDEAIDGFLFRAWLEAYVRALAVRDNAGITDGTLCERLDKIIKGRFERPKKWSPTEICDLLKECRSRKFPVDALTVLADPEIGNAEGAANSLAHGGASNSDSIRQFLRDRGDLPLVDEEIEGLGYARWPYLGDKRELILIAMGSTDQVEGDNPPTPRLDALIDWMRGDDVEPVIRIVVSAESALVGRLWEEKARAKNVDCRVLLECGINFDDLEWIRSNVQEALAAEGNLDAVDKIHIAVGPGPKPQILALLLAGLEWALRAACPARLVELRRKMRNPVPALDETYIDVDPDAVLNRVIGDSGLAEVAVSALECLDTSAAATLLDRGSPRLRPLAVRVRRLSLVLACGQRSADGDAESGIEPDWLASIGIADYENASLLLLRARLKLVQTLADSDLWGCAMRAAVLCEGTLGKNGDTGWYTLKNKKNAQYILAAYYLNEYRNDSPAVHGKERKERADRRKEAPKLPPLRDCLEDLCKGLSEHVMVNGQGLPDTWDNVLVDELESLKRELGAFIASG